MPKNENRLNRINEELKKEVSVKTGIFGADMQISFRYFDYVVVFF